MKSTTARATLTGVGVETMNRGSIILLQTAVSLVAVLFTYFLLFGLPALLGEVWS